METPMVVILLQKADFDQWKVCFVKKIGILFFISHEFLKLSYLQKIANCYHLFATLIDTPYFWQTTQCNIWAIYNLYSINFQNIR